MTLRPWVQGFSVVIFFALFALAATPVAKFIPSDLFLRTDPLAAAVVVLSGSIGLSIFLPALIVLLSAMVGGRIFCGWVCPLGTLFDIGSRWQKRERMDPRWLLRLRGTSAAVLAFVLISAFLGFSLLGWFDPLVLLTRTLTLIGEPWLLETGSSIVNILRPLAHELNFHWLSEVQIHPPKYWLVGLSLVWMALVFGISVWRSRLWCRAFCPLGGLLGLVGIKSLVRRRVGQECTGCGRCERICPMGAIKGDPTLTDPLRCINCKRCQEGCPTKAIRFGGAAISSNDTEKTSIGGIERRSFLVGAAAGLVASLTMRVDAGRASPRDRLIRPPGAVPEEIFTDRCLRCGLCMSVCMSHTIQPSFLQGGLNGIWTPRLDLRLAPCEKHCNRCGQVCPTGAIRSLSLEERIHAKIGTAMIQRERCLVWEQDKMCLVCDEICPYDAIEFREVEGMRRPFVTENRCNGCGYCEHKCPVQGESAIIVVRAGEVRLEKGSYIEEARARGLVFEGARDQNQIKAPELSQGGVELPPGFLKP